MQVTNEFNAILDIEELRQDFIDEVKEFDDDRLVAEHNSVFATDWELVEDNEDEEIIED